MECPELQCLTNRKHVSGDNSSAGSSESIHILT